MCRVYGRTIRGRLLVHKSIKLDTEPPITVKIWEDRKGHFWRYDYNKCPKNGPFPNYQQALTDCINYSTQ